MFDHKNDQVIRETEHNLHGPKQPDLVLRMSMARIKEATTSSLGSQSRLLQDESTDESAGYLPRLATVKVLFVTGK